MKNKKQNKKSRKRDYRAIFGMGTIFVAVGVVFMTTLNTPLGVMFMGVGGLYMIIGAKHKNEWKKK